MREHTELLQLKEIEEQILGVGIFKVRALDEIKLAPASDMPHPPMSEKVQAKAHAYKLATGRSPSAKEIQRWMGSKY